MFSCAIGFASGLDFKRGESRSLIIVRVPTELMHWQSQWHTE